MCLNVVDQFARTRALSYFTSTFLAAHLTEFRNLPEGEQVNAGHISRRVVGELGYAALAVAAVVEMIFRLALAALLLIPSIALTLLCGDTSICGSNYEWGTPIWIINRSGLFLGPDTALRCLVALVKNITEERFDYSSLAFCELDAD